MSDSTHPETPRVNGGYLALSIFGWLELGVSVICVALDVIIPALGFALASVLLGFIANQVRGSRIDYRGHIPAQQRAAAIPLPPAKTARFRILHLALLALAATALIGAGILAFYGLRGHAIVAGLWSISLVNLSARYRVGAA